MTQQLRTAASPMFKVDLLAARISRDFRQNRPRDEQSFGVLRRNPFGPARRERFRDGPGRPQAARAQVWVSRRFRASSRVPAWSRPDCSRLSSLGGGAGGRPCQAAARVRPTAIGGVILNDIGPVIEPQGLVRIKGYVGKLPVPRSFEEGAEILRWWFHAQFPKLAPQDWIAFAQRTWREHEGRLVPDYDLTLARTLQGADLQHPPTLWNHFDALTRVPLMVIRGGNSDMLAPTTLQAMLSRRSELEVAIVPDQGHAPLLAEPKLIRRIAAFVASCDVSTRLSWGERLHQIARVGLLAEPAG